MRLKDDFFNIVSFEPIDDGFKCKVCLNSQHQIYQAHFPGTPITPGVCLLQMVTEMLEQHIGQALELKSAIDIKFRQIVPPDIQPFFFIKGLSSQHNELLNIGVSIENEENTQLARMSLSYKIINH